ncbi:MAG: protein kinase, partial [Chloroflexi bacterium]|nr:protein kinase [Chloroflexota bacterium]
MERILNGRYRLLEKIGDGGMAVVYLSEDILLDRQVAVKILRDQYASDERFLARFRREAKAAANLSHPNIVSIFDVGQDGDTHYIVMERIEGTSLKEVLAKEGALSAARAVRIATQVCSALGYAHRKGLVHRDIKPQNILMVHGEQVKVVDFGIAKGLTDVSLTDEGTALGTVHYLSPEQARGEPTTALSDLYSLGVVLYEMSTGHLPFESDTAVGVALKHIESEPELPRNLNPAVPATLESIILKAMSKDPNSRFASAGEFAEALSGYQRFGQDRTVPVPLTRPSSKRSQESRERPAPKVPSRVAVDDRPRATPNADRRVAARVQKSKSGIGCGGIAIAALVIVI